MDTGRTETQTEKAYRILKETRRPMSVAEIVGLGGSRIALHRLAASGKIDRDVRGIYRIPEPEEDQRAAWGVIAMAVPEAVFCMQSAAAYHGLTQNSAAHLDVAVPAGRSVPSESMTAIPARWTKWSRDKAFEVGVMTVEVGGRRIRITDPERTVVDVFRYSSLVPQRRMTAVAVDDETALDVIARYFAALPDDSPVDLYRMAGEFGMKDRIAPYIKMVTAQRAVAPR